MDFPLFLVLASAATGLVWLLELLFLRPRRQAAAAALPQPQQQRALRQPKLVEYAALFFPVFALVLALRSFLFEPFQIPSESMLPTLEAGDFILVNKYNYGLRLPVLGTKVVDIGGPRRGQVMVFFPPHKDEYFIKRVVGLPGDRVLYEGKTLYINGEAQRQTRVPSPSQPQSRRYQETLGENTHLIERSAHPQRRPGEWLVPAGHYFVMGDNRDRSSDSRAWGMVPEERIVGQAVAVWLHKPPGLRLPHFSRNGWIQ